MATKNGTTNSSVIEGRNLVAKYDGHIVRSGEISGGLRQLPDNNGLYEQVQHGELVLHTARKAWDVQSIAYSAARTAEEKVRRQLATTARAVVSISEAVDWPALGTVSRDRVIRSRSRAISEQV